MDITSLIIGLVLTIAILIPVYFLAKAGKKNNKQIASDFTNLAKTYSLNITEQSHWAHYSIGIDKVNSKLIYRAGEDKIEIVDLSIMKQCLVINKINKVKNRQYNEKMLLELSPKESGAQKTFIEFYNHNTAIQLADELVLLEKWEKIVSSCITNK